MRKLYSGGGEVVSLTDAKAFLKVDIDDDDELIIAMVKSARLWAEKYTGRQLITAVYDLYLDEFPDTIELYPCPVTQISSIKYYDADGVEQTLSSTYYTTDIISEPARIVEAPDYDWPDTDGRINAITIRYTTGYTLATVPYPIKQAILFIIGHLYENRQSVTKDVYRMMPRSSEYLLDFYKVY
jgi:uncharacterized phiE125 gp8 family phage protein